MGKIEVSKSEAARRQIDTAIRMLYSGEDPVAIHTVAMAGFRVARDLSARRDDSYMNQAVKAFLVPGKEKEFWGATNSFANFLKHADRDADGLFSGVDEEVNDAALFLACMYYQDQGFPLTAEMAAHMGLFTIMHPGFMRPNVDPKFLRAIATLAPAFKRLSRKEQLALGNELLSHSREQPGTDHSEQPGTTGDRPRLKQLVGWAEIRSPTANIMLGYALSG